MIEDTTVVPAEETTPEVTPVDAPAEEKADEAPVA